MTKYINMETTNQIKKNLILKIKSSNDLVFLKSIQSLFESTEQDFYELSPEQENSISIGRQQIKNGQFSESKTVISEMREWLGTN